MAQIKNALVELLKDEEGPTMVEYALMVALIGVALIATVTGLKTGVANTFKSATGAMPTA